MTRRETTWYGTACLRLLWPLSTRFPHTAWRAYGVHASLHYLSSVLLSPRSIFHRHHDGPPAKVPKFTVSKSTLPKSTLPQHQGSRSAQLSPPSHLTHPPPRGSASPAQQRPRQRPESPRSALTSPLSRRPSHRCRARTPHRPHKGPPCRSARPPAHKLCFHRSVRWGTTQAQSQGRRWGSRR